MSGGLQVRRIVDRAALIQLITAGQQRSHTGVDGCEGGIAFRLSFSLSTLIGSSERSASAICFAMSSSSVSVAARVVRFWSYRSMPRMLLAMALYASFNAWIRSSVAAALLATATDQTQRQNQSGRLPRDPQRFPLPIAHSGPRFAVSAGPSSNRSVIAQHRHQFRLLLAGVAGEAQFLCPLAQVIDIPVVV